MKPILVVYMPRDTASSDYNLIGISLSKVKELNDNYIVINVIGTKDEWEFKGLFPQDFDAVKFEDFKNMVKTEIKKGNFSITI